jgi:hypothetical protein
VTGDRTRFHQAAHRRSVPVEVTVLERAGVGVGVEVDESNLTEPVDLGHPGRVRVGDGVIATEDDRHLSRSGDRLHRLFDARQRLLHVAGDHVDVTHIDDTQEAEWIDPGGQMRAVAVHGSVVGLPDRLRTESGAGAVGGPPIERCADYRHLALDGGKLVEADRRDSEERLSGGERDVLRSCERDLFGPLFVGCVRGLGMVHG